MGFDFEEYLKDLGVGEDKVKSNGTGSNGHAVVSNPTKYAISAYESELNRLSLTVEGGRNDQLNRSAFNIAQLVANGYLDGQVARDGLYTVARQVGLGGTEINKTIGSAFSAALPRSIDVQRVSTPESLELAPEATTEPGTTPVPIGTPEANSWDPQDLYPYFDGSLQPEVPTVGLVRADGLSMLYRGKEHTVIGEMESGKSWFSLACCLAEINKENPVLYIHFEESNPYGTVLRLKDMGLLKDQLELFHFVGPEQHGTMGAVERLVALQPTLVILDGVNEAMGMHSWKINDPDGYAAFRRALIKPFTACGAATLAADHVSKDPTSRGRTALGSVHKVNALSGVAISLENKEPFGRGQTGRSHVYILKDRPGYLRQHGDADKLAGKTYMGTLIGESNDLGDFKGIGIEIKFIKPLPNVELEKEMALDADALTVLNMVKKVLSQQDECCMTDLYDRLPMRDKTVRDAVDRLKIADRIGTVSQGRTKLIKLGQNQTGVDQEGQGD